MSTKGILRAWIKDDNHIVRTVHSTDYLELEGEKNTFTAFLDERCLGDNTTNKQSTIKNAQWLIVREGFWNSLSNANKEKSPAAFYQEIIKPAEKELSPIYLNGGKVKIDIEEHKDKITPGEVYLLLPFSSYPEKDVAYKSIRFVYLEAPRVDYAYIQEPSQDQADLPSTSNEKLHIYGEQAKLCIRTQLIPDPRIRKSAELSAMVYFIDKQNKRQAVTYFDIPIEAGATDYISTTEHNINIQPDWKELDGGHQSGNQPRAYYVSLSYIQSEEEDIEANKKGIAHDKIFHTTEVPWSKIEEVKYDTQYLEKGWGNFSSEDQKPKLEDMVMQEAIKVRWDTWQTILDKFEVDKTDKIVYIGDVRYTKREYDPCGFSKIIIQDKKDKTREPFTIFDQENLSLGADRTESSFDIIAGDERKEITITLDELTNKNVNCHGVMLPKGRIHEELDNVFQLDKAYSVLKIGDDYEREEDKTHKEQLEHTGTPITDENEVDTDVVLDSKKMFSEPDLIQNFRKGTDYKFIGEDELQLNLKYFYNKTVAEGTSIENGLLDTLWVFRYFWLDEAKAQTYFVPISTCRYPNQIARVRVFPDIEWELATLITVPLWKKTTFKFQSTREELRNYHERYSFRYIKRELSVETEKEVGADFTLKSSTGGKDYEIGYKIEKSIKKVIDTFNVVYEKSEIFDGRDANMTESAALKKGALKKIEFTIDPPNVAIALKWKHDVSKLEKNIGKIGWRIEGGIALKPFIGFGITVDLVPIVGKFGWVGKAVELIIKTLEYTIRGLDVYFNFILTAEVADSLSIGYHNLDGWDEKAERGITITVNASLEAGVNYEGTELISTIVQDGITYETQEELKIKASLGAGIEYKEEWDLDDKGMFKNVTVTFLGAEAKLEIYSSITRRKKTVYNDDEVVSNKKGNIKHNDVHKLLEKEIWYGPKKIYTADEEYSK